jgi:hypothetical protein
MFAQANPRELNAEGYRAMASMTCTNTSPARCLIWFRKVGARGRRSIQAQIVAARSLHLI